MNETMKRYTQNKKMITCWVDREDLKKLDHSLLKSHYRSRTHFISQKIKLFNKEMIIKIDMNF